MDCGASSFCDRVFGLCLHAALDTADDDASCSAEPGQYVTMVLLDVSQDAATSLQRRVIRKDGRAPDPLIACGLLPHENQLSVVHMLVQRCPEYEEPVKSKTPLVVHLGFRRFTSRPIYSDHNINSDKAKLQRYMLNGFTVATGARATGGRQPNTHPQMPPYACLPVHAQCVSEGRRVTVELVG